jgi:SNW domain-containing protein 1
MAQKACDTRADLRHPGEGETSVELNERDEIRAQRHRDRARDRNLARAAPDKRSKL